ncbi:MAG: hypothetical protein ABIK09_17635 [Pseudomonadota bacterium]
MTAATQHWWQAVSVAREGNNVHHWTRVDWQRLADLLRLVEYRWVQLLLVGVALLGVVLLIRAWPRFQRLGATDRWLLFGALAVGILLRTLWAEPAMIHENYCGVGRLACAAEPPCIRVTRNHGVASFAGYNLIMGLTGGSDRGVIAANVVLAGLVHLLLLFALVRDATGSPRAGALAAWSLALLPVHIRMSPTESFFPLASALLLGSVLALRSLATRADLPRAALAAVLVALTVMSAKAYNLQAAFGLGVYLLAVLRGGRVRVRPLAVAAGLFLVLTAAHYVRIFLEPVQAGSYLPETLALYAEQMFGNNLFLERDATPLILLLAWPAGALLVLRGGRRGSWDLLLLLLGFSVVFTNSDPGDVTWPTRVRMQMNLAPFVAAMAGIALHVAARRPVGRVALAALAVASLWQIPAQDAMVRELLVPAQEARYLEKMIPRLPPLDVLVTVDHTLPFEAARCGDPVETHFPLHLLRLEQGDQVEWVRLGRFLDEQERFEGRVVVFYLGTTAYARLPEEIRLNGPDAGLRRAVAEALEGLVLTPIPGTSEPIPAVNPGRVRNHYAGSEIPVGFFRVEVRAPGPDG